MSRLRLLVLVLLLPALLGRAEASSTWKTAGKTMAKNLVATARSPKKVARIAASFGVGLGAGVVAMHLGAPAGATSFASYTMNTVVDRLIDKRWPETRAVGQPAPPPLWRDALATFAGATATGLATPFLLREMANIPALSLGVPLMLAKPSLRLVGSIGASAIARSVRVGTNMWLRVVGDARSEERVATVIP